MYVSRTHLDLYADESEAGVGGPVSCFYVSRLPHLPTYFEPRGHPQTETSNPNRQAKIRPTLLGMRAPSWGHKNTTTVGRGRDGGRRGL